MIQREELRIGNYLQFWSDLGIVQKIDYKHVDLYDPYSENGTGTWDYPAYDHPNLDYLNLTEEWLIKLGFEKINELEYKLNNFILTDTDYGICLYDREGRLIRNGIKHVHQIQTFSNQIWMPSIIH